MVSPGRSRGTRRPRTCTSCTLAVQSHIQENGGGTPSSDACDRPPCCGLVLCSRSSSRGLLPLVSKRVFSNEKASKVVAREAQRISMACNTIPCQSSRLSDERGHDNERWNSFAESFQCSMLRATMDRARLPKIQAVLGSPTPHDVQFDLPDISNRCTTATAVPFLAANTDVSRTITRLHLQFRTQHLIFLSHT